MLTCKKCGARIDLGKERYTQDLKGDYRHLSCDPKPKSYGTVKVKMPGLDPIVFVILALSLGGIFWVYISHYLSVFYSVMVILSGLVVMLVIIGWTRWSDKKEDALNKDKPYRISRM